MSQHWGRPKVLLVSLQDLSFCLCNCLCCILLGIKTILTPLILNLFRFVYLSIKKYNLRSIKNTYQYTNLDKDIFKQHWRLWGLYQEWCAVLEGIRAHAFASFLYNFEISHFILYTSFYHPWDIITKMYLMHPGGHKALMNISNARSGLSHAAVYYIV